MQGGNFIMVENTKKNCLFSLSNILGESPDDKNIVPIFFKKVLIFNFHFQQFYNSNKSKFISLRTDSVQNVLEKMKTGKRGPSSSL